MCAYLSRVVEVKHPSQRHKVQANIMPTATAAKTAATTAATTKNNSCINNNQGHHHRRNHILHEEKNETNQNTKYTAKTKSWREGEMANKSLSYPVILTFRQTVSSLSLNTVRRSECPHNTYSHPTEASMPVETAPVKAPWFSMYRFCAPTET